MSTDCCVKVDESDREQIVFRGDSRFLSQIGYHKTRTAATKMTRLSLTDGSIDKSTSTRRGEVPLISRHILFCGSRKLISSRHKYKLGSSSFTTALAMILMLSIVQRKQISCSATGVISELPPASGLETQQQQQETKTNLQQVINRNINSETWRLREENNKQAKVEQIGSTFGDWDAINLPASVLASASPVTVTAANERHAAMDSLALSLAQAENSKKLELGKTKRGASVGINTIYAKENDANDTHEDSDDDNDDDQDEDDDDNQSANQSKLPSKQKEVAPEAAIATGAGPSSDTLTLTARTGTADAVGVTRGGGIGAGGHSGSSASSHETSDASDGSPITGELSPVLPEQQQQHHHHQRPLENRKCNLIGATSGDSTVESVANTKDDARGGDEYELVGVSLDRRRVRRSVVGANELEENRRQPPAGSLGKLQREQMKLEESAADGNGGQIPSKKLEKTASAATEAPTTGAAKAQNWHLATPTPKTTATTSTTTTAAAMGSAAGDGEELVDRKEFQLPGLSGGFHHRRRQRKPASASSSSMGNYDKFVEEEAKARYESEEEEDENNDSSLPLARSRVTSDHLWPAGQTQSQYDERSLDRLPELSSSPVQNEQSLLSTTRSQQSNNHQLMVGEEDDDGMSTERSRHNNNHNDNHLHQARKANKLELDGAPPLEADNLFLADSSARSPSEYWLTASHELLLASNELDNEELEEQEDEEDGDDNADPDPTIVDRTNVWPLDFNDIDLDERLMLAEETRRRKLHRLRVNLQHKRQARLLRHRRAKSAPAVQTIYFGGFFPWLTDESEQISDGSQVVSGGGGGSSSSGGGSGSETTTNLAAPYMKQKQRSKLKHRKSGGGEEQVRLEKYQQKQRQHQQESSTATAVTSSWFSSYGGSRRSPESESLLLSKGTDDDSGGDAGSSAGNSNQSMGASSSLPSAIHDHQELESTQHATSIPRAKTIETQETSTKLPTSATTAGDSAAMMMAAAAAAANHQHSQLMTPVVNGNSNSNYNYNYAATSGSAPSAEARHQLGKSILPAVRLALDHININSSVLGGYRLEVVPRDTQVSYRPFSFSPLLHTV